MIFYQLLAYKTRKSQRKHQSSRQSIGFKKAKQVGLIFSYDDPEKSAIVERLITDLKSDGKEVKVLAFERNRQIKHLPYDSFCQKDINFWCKYITPNLTNFVRREFDFLICIDNHPNALIKNVLANSKAKCRVGRHNEDNLNSFELMIGDKQLGAASWVASMYDYLKIIH